VVLDHFVLTLKGLDQLQLRTLPCSATVSTSAACLPVIKPDPENGRKKLSCVVIRIWMTSWLVAGRNVFCP
jgi:hypothetical protein